MIDINYKKRIKKRLKKGNGVLIFGSFFMILILMIVIMFAQIFTMRQSALDLQNAADSISDGTATYLQSEGGNYEDAQKQAVKLKNMINSNTKANIKQLTVNKSSLENDNIVSVKLEKNSNIIRQKLKQNFYISKELQLRKLLRAMPAVMYNGQLILQMITVMDTVKQTEPFQM